MATKKKTAAKKATKKVAKKKAAKRPAKKINMMRAKNLINKDSN